MVILAVGAFVLVVLIAALVIGTVQRICDVMADVENM